MKLASYLGPRGRRLGIVNGDAIIDVAEHLPDLTSMEALIEGGPASLDRVRRIAERDSPTIELSTVRLAAPLSRPQKFLAIGMNYRKHAEEAKRLGIETTKHQFWFNKQTSCLNGPYDPIVKPTVSDKLDYEAELAMVIGKQAKHVGRSRASEHIFGYTVCNDVSVRDWQMHSPTMTVGKSFDTHGPIGPWIVTADEIPDPHKLSLRCGVTVRFVSSRTLQNLFSPFPEKPPRMHWLTYQRLDQVYHAAKRRCIQGHHRTRGWVRAPDAHLSAGPAS